MIVYFLNDFFMYTVVLDFSDGNVKIIHHKEMDIDDIEMMLFDENKYDFSQNNIQWMTVKDLVIKDISLQNKLLNATFSIDENEINEAAGFDVGNDLMRKILSDIENNEWIWSAIEVAKKEALDFFLKPQS